MGQVASAFPTAGGLYHWASILGDRGWGWATAWFNLGGLVTALAAVNVGAFQFGLQAIGPWLGYPPQSFSELVANGAADCRRRGDHRVAGDGESSGNSPDDLAHRFQRLLGSSSSPWALTIALVVLRSTATTSGGW